MFQYKLRYAWINDALGSVDANQGDKLLGWDTDQFPTDVYAITESSATFESLNEYVLDNVELQSRKQEPLKHLLNRYITRT